MLKSNDKALFGSVYLQKNIIKCSLLIDIFDQ